MAKVRIEVTDTALAMILRAKVDADLSHDRFQDLPQEDLVVIREARIGKLETLCESAWGSTPVIEIDEDKPQGSATVRELDIPF